MSKPRGGLQKRISSIFDGVPVESEPAHGTPKSAEGPGQSVPSAPSSGARPAPTTEPPRPAQSASPADAPVRPKAPPAPPGLSKPKFEPRPSSNLMAAMASETAAPPQRATPPRPTEPARPSHPPAERSAPAAPKAAPRVVVKKIGAANATRNKNIMLIGGLSVVLVIAILWSTGRLSGGNPDPFTGTPDANPGAGVPSTIVWTLPAKPPIPRNPMRLGSSSTPTKPSGPTESACSFNVTAIYRSQDRVVALVDGTVMAVGSTHCGAKVIAISDNYVEFQIEGGTRREYIDNFGSNQPGSTDVKPDSNTNNN